MNRSEIEEFYAISFDEVGFSLIDEPGQSIVSFSDQNLAGQK